MEKQFYIVINLKVKKKLVRLKITKNNVILKRFCKDAKI